jgi:DNA-directed RNA polymerase specialized sigma24 family protein
VDISDLDLEEIARSCVQESARFFRGQVNDPRFCFELFRRAFVQRDQTAWEHLYRTYRPLVSKWINSHPAFEDSGEELDYFANRTFDKIWYSITPAKFSNFKELSALLGYLKMCTGSVIIDHTRSKEKLTLEELEDSIASEPEAKEPDVEDLAIAHQESKLLWQRIKECLSDRQEYIVVYACFVLDLKPREILLQFPGLFADVGEVYRNKENVMDKLRRNSELIKLLGDVSVKTG